MTINQLNKLSKKLDKLDDNIYNLKNYLETPENYYNYVVKDHSFLYEVGGNLVYEDDIEYTEEYLELESKLENMQKTCENLEKKFYQEQKKLKLMLS